MTQFQKLVERDGHRTAIEKGEHVFHQGEDDSHIYLVQSGLLKAYYIQPDGREHIKSFVAEGGLIGSMVAMFGGGACTFGLMALEDCDLIALPYQRLEEAAQRDQSLSLALVLFLSAHGQRKEKREYELLCLAPEERYRIALLDMPDLAARISQADLAAYIGVTPQALSRIKRRIGNQTR